MNGSGGIARGWIDHAAAAAIHQQLNDGCAPTDFGPRWRSQRMARILASRWRALRRRG